ncbi:MULTISPECIES: hypothetical protein [Xanthomonas]|nr:MULTISPECIES: hypothetical protein [Xanthomonas]PPT80147.1 hypothetical protein XarbCFBP8152_06540 [Xanthomonas arboricola]
MFHSIRSIPLPPSAAVLLLAPPTAANDSVAPAPVADVPLLDFRCGRTGTRNRDIWSGLPDIRSARQARRLRQLAKSGALLTAAAMVSALAVASYLMH